MNLKLIYFIFISLSLILLIRFYTFYSSVEKYPDNSVVTWQLRLLDQPKLKNGAAQVAVFMPNSQKVILRLSVFPVVLYGDVLTIQGRVDYFKAENGAQIAIMNYPKFEIIEKGSESNIIYKTREEIILFFNSSLPQIYSSLMLGIVFGIKEEMPADFYLDLQKTGLMHVIAASGMNITMLGGFLSLFFLLFLKRNLAILMTILGIVLYASLAGFEPSIVRASLMGILVLLAQLTGRQSNSFFALFLAGFLMLMRNPSLIYDIGFQLSFLATFGLIFFRPIFSIKSSVKNVLDKSIIGNDLATTLTAQIMTLPILLINFGSYSLWSIPVNAIILWTIPFLMIIGGISALISFIFEPFGRIILFLSILFLLYFTKIVEFFGQFHGQIEIKSLPILLLCGYYLIIISIILYLKKRT